MKKLLFLGLLLTTVGLFSCKKTGKCTCNVAGFEVSETYEDLDNEEYQNRKDDCEAINCEWSLGN